MNTMSNNESVLSSTVLRFTKGCAAGFVAALLLQPLAVVKTSMQITPIEKKVVDITP